MAGIEQAPTLSELVGRISLADTLGSVATAAASVVSVAGLILIYTLFLFVEQVHFKRQLGAIFHGDGQEARVLAVLDRIDREIRVYIRIKTTLATATSALAYVVMASVGVDFAGFWAVMVFFFYYIPTVGSILAIIAPALLTLIQFDNLHAVPDRAAGVRLDPGRDGQRHRAGDHGTLAQPLAAGGDRLPDRMGHDLGRGRHVPLRAHHGGGADRARAVRDDPAGRRAAVRRRPHPGVDAMKRLALLLLALAATPALAQVASPDRPPAASPLLSPPRPGCPTGHRPLRLPRRHGLRSSLLG